MLKNCRYLVLLSAILCFFLKYSGADAFVFTKNLSLGMRGKDVVVLKVLLGGLGTSDYFDVATRQAVMDYQWRNRGLVLAPAGLTHPTGVVGARTRAVLNTQITPEQSRSTAISPVAIAAIPAFTTPTTVYKATSDAPTIISVTPATVGPTNTITIIGTNFDATNNTVITGFGTSTAVPSSGGIITLRLGDISAIGTLASIPKLAHSKIPAWVMIQTARGVSGQGAFSLQIP